ncbi:MAG: hypothetical protein KTR28_07265 [Micavibrio sp.]|nr:hypothetical protein [Micavibrio sp.]
MDNMTVLAGVFVESIGAIALKELLVERGIYEDLIEGTLHGQAKERAVKVRIYGHDPLLPPPIM